jgi:hypothetical protein
MTRRSRLFSGAGLAVCCLSAEVRAGVPIEFPPAVSTEDWAPALLLGDLEVGAATGESWVKVEIAESLWVLRVRDRSGQVHRVEIDIPQTSADREALVVLAASLIEPSPSRQLPGLERPASASLPMAGPQASSAIESSIPLSTDEQLAVAEPDIDEVMPPEPEPEPEPDQPPVSEPVVADLLPIEPTSSLQPVTPAAESPEADRSRTAPPAVESLEPEPGAVYSVRSGAGAVVRAGIEPSPAMELGLSIESPRLQLSGIVRGIPSSGLDLMEGERSVASGEFWTEAARSISRLRLGIGLGLRALRFEDPAVDMESWVIEPSTALSLGLQLFETGRLQFGTDVTLGMDLGKIQLRLDDVDQGQFPRASLCVKWTVHRRLN